jgi:prolyl oligopeptidase
MTAGYPDARRLDLVEQLHGYAVADPYRWLEDAASDECEAWSRAQDDLARAHLDGLPGRAELAARLRALLPGVVSAPVMRGPRAFYTKREADQELPTYYVDDRPLIDPAVLDPSLATVLDGAAPSKEGDRVAAMLSHGGREESALHVLDVASGASVAAPVELGRGGTFTWLPGGEELVVVRCLGLPGEEQFHRRVWRHRVGTDPSQDLLLFGEGRDKTTYYEVTTSPDGRWLLVTASLGTAPRNDAYLIDLSTGAVAVVLEGEDVLAWGGVAFDGRLYLLTNRDAPRFKLCIADPSSPAVWRDLVAESDDVLEDYAVTTAGVVVVRVHDVVARVAVHDAQSGERVRDIALPGLGSATVSARHDGGDDVWITYTDFVTPPTVYHSAGADELSVWAGPPGAIEVQGSTTTQVFVTSKDGTRVPMFVIAPDGVALDGDNPTILYGYGGFNVPLSPAYSSAALAWVEGGGVYAIANLRGGSEYGEEWHRAGMRERKQNVFDDFIAAAEWLVAERYTSSERLAISGGSNGGLLVGAALTQRPELFRAVHCSAPLLDMVRYELFGLGQTWNDEYGRASDPVELEWLLSYSPYHHVRDGVRYPAVLFTVFEGDTRVDPLHARKLCAALQHATSASVDERPILIRRETAVGHGARALSRTIGLQTDSLSFLRFSTRPVRVENP